VLAEENEHRLPRILRRAASSDRSSAATTPPATRARPSALGSSNHAVDSDAPPATDPLDGYSTAVLDRVRTAELYAF